MRGPSGSKGQLERFQPIGRSGQRSEDHLKSGHASVQCFEENQRQ